jgi:hypothetical protein
MPAMPFIDDDGADDFDGLPLRTALDLREYFFHQTMEPFRRQIIIARELGPTATTADYEIACMAEHVVPWPVGDRLAIEKR